MAITQKLNSQLAQTDYFGASTDIKPTLASHTGLTQPRPGDTFWAQNTNLLYKTYDGTNWVLFLTLG